MILIRNERFGGIVYNSRDGNMCFVDHHGLSVALKHIRGIELNQEEVNFAHTVLGDHHQDIKFLIKQELPQDASDARKCASPVFVDLSITDQCNQECPYCYMDAKKSGTFLDMDDFKFLLNEFQSNRVFQVALGGGEPTLHPDFITILKKLHKRNITPNYTTNGSKLTKEIVNATKNFCGAVGVSHSNSRKEEVMDALTQYLAVGVEAHLHVIVSHSTISTLPNIIQDYINIGIRMFDLLLFKPKGRAASLKKEIITVDDIPVYYEIFKEIHSRYGRSIRMSFDACFTPINIGLPVKPETIEGCPGSRHTIHIDHQLLAKPCSFLSNNYCFSLQEKSIKDAWNSPQFQSFRKHLFNSDKGACSECKYHGVCWGKCPEIEELHLCYKEINERN